MMSKLYEIAADALALSDLLDEIGGDVTDPRIESAAVEMAAALEADERTELERLRQGIASLEMRAAAAEAEAEQYLRIAKAHRAAVAWIKGNVKHHLEATGKPKAETATGRKFWVQANGTSPLEIAPGISPHDVPERYRRVVVDFDTKSIREAVARGDEDAAFAKLGPRGTHLRHN